MPQLLVISWAMPPLVLPRALQVSRLLKELSFLDWPSTVLTVSSQSITRGVVIDYALQNRYAGYFDLRTVESPEQSRRYRALYKCLPWFRQRPDEHRPWIRPAIASGRALLSTGRFSAIASFAQPWSSHLVGLKLHQLTGLPWIAHFSDPWSHSPYSRAAGCSHRVAQRMEESVLRQANQLVFVNKETMEITLKQHPPAWKEKASVVPHGYDRHFLDQLKPPTAAPDGRLRLTYVGNFYGIRTPGIFLNALSQLNTRRPIKELIQVQFVGCVPREYINLSQQLKLDAVVRFLGPMRSLDAFEIMRDSDALLLIDTPDKNTSLFFPSKLVDYLLFQKPILGLTPATGTSADILRRLQCPVIHPDDTEGIIQGLSDLITSKKANTLFVTEEFRRTAEQYDVRHAACAFLNVLKNASKQ